MVNKTKFYKTKVALAVVLSLGLAACGDEEGSTSTSQSTADASQPGSVNQQASGSIQGVVLDTNGTPVVGATVTTAGMVATTDTSGSYKFDGVQVANVAGADANTGHEPFVIVIQSPEGYASTATVNVAPNAQIDADNTGTTGTTGIPLTTFIDGFLAQADTAVIPKMESTVEGVLRSSTTGEAVANAKVALDFKALSTTLNNGGTNFTLSGETVYVMTDADGKFTFENVSNDSTFDLNVEGYDFITSGDQTTDDLAVTTAEQVTQWLGDISVVAHSTADSIAPFITSATGVFGQTTPVAPATTVYGMLNRGIDQTFTINFSEPVDAAAFNTSDVLVALSNASYLATDSITLAADGKSMTVVLSEALDEGDKISIFIPSADAMDVAGNLFSTTDNDVAAYDVDYDSSITADSGKAGYIKVNLCIFIEPTTGGSGVATQVVDDEAGEDGGSSALADYSNAFVDSREDSGDSVVQQINGSDSAERLSVFRAIQGNDTTTDNFTAVGGETSFTLTEAPVGILSFTVAGADVQVTSINGKVLTVPAVAAGAVVVEYVEANYVDTATRASIEFDGSAIATAANGVSGSDGTTALSSSASASKLYFDFDGVSHGSQEKIVYSDDLGIETKSETITFTDQAKPTTVIQDDYDLHGYNNSGTYTATVTTSGQAQYGNGGETSHAGINDIPGNPTLYIQPRHLAQKGANGAAPVRGTEFDELVADMSNRLGSGESPAAAVGAESTLTRFAPNDPALSAPLYDADAFASWTVGQDIGVAFSEVIALATTAPTYTGTETLTGFAAENSVSEDVDGNTNVILANPSGVTEIEADLVLFTTSDVVDLANNDNGAILGFAGAVSDARGNVADTESNAQVVMLDAMPPMVTSAQWTGTDLVVTFNEAVTLSSTTASNLQVWDPTDSTNTSAAIGVTTSNGTLSTDAKTLTVALTTAQATSISGTFADGNDNEFLYEDNSAASGEENHAVLAWDGVNDTNGNDWDQFNNAVDGTYTNRYEVRAPRFLMVNGVGTFTYSVATTGYIDDNADGADDDGDVSFTITFTHPINLTSTYDVANTTATTVTALATAIEVGEGTGWSANGTAGATSTQTSWTSSTGADLATMNAIFNMEDIGTTSAGLDAGTAATFATVPTTDDETSATIVISADFRTITLNINAANEGVAFGKSDFIFNTEVDSSLITGAKTSAGRFNWQNTQ